MNKPLLRPMQATDLEAVLCLEQAAYSHPWTRGILHDCLRSGYIFWVLESEQQIIAYSVLSAAAGEAHLLNLCVASPYQGQKLGSYLLHHLLSLAKQSQAEKVFLEVRASNHAACALYHQIGFQDIGLRKAYYPAEQGREDARVMALEL